MKKQILFLTIMAITVLFVLTACEQTDVSGKAVKALSVADDDSLLAPGDISDNGTNITNTTHTECIDELCVVVAGYGTNECNEDTDCLTAPVNQTSCIDSESGPVYDEFGVVIYTWSNGTVQNLSDYCTGAHGLKEYYCEGTEAGVETVDCWDEGYPNCIGGECVMNLDVTEYDFSYDGGTDLSDAIQDATSERVYELSCTGSDTCIYVVEEGVYTDTIYMWIDYNMNITEDMFFYVNEDNDVVLINDDDAEIGLMFESDAFLAEYTLEHSWEDLSEANGGTNAEVLSLNVNADYGIELMLDDTFTDTVYALIAENITEDSLFYVDEDSDVVLATFDETEATMAFFSTVIVIPPNGTNTTNVTHKECQNGLCVDVLGGNIPDECQTNEHCEVVQNQTDQTDFFVEQMSEIPVNILVGDEFTIYYMIGNDGPGDGYATHIFNTFSPIGGGGDSTYRLYSAGYVANKTLSVSIDEGKGWYGFNVSLLPVVSELETDWTNNYLNYEVYARLGNCSEYSGNICASGAACTGDWIDAADSDRCCSGKCQKKVTFWSTMFGWWG